MDSLAAAACPDCGSELGPGLLACPRCARLVHAETLKDLAAQAERAQREGDAVAALTAWRRALELLPPDARQHAVVLAKVQALSERAEAPAPTRGGWAKGAAGLGALGLLLWKFKAVAAFVLTKGKFLLLGLTKASTFFSMILAVGAYWALWGWRFALGFVLCLYVHEMGHVWMLRRYGLAASAPLFIPGLGAFIRLRQTLTTPREDARMGLAGPLWGMAASAACLGVYALTDFPFWAALARFNAWVNLFNLLPLWQLDGSRGFRALTRGQRWIATGLLLGAYLWVGDGLLLLIALTAGVRAWGGDAAPQADRIALLQYGLLVVVLSAGLKLPVPLP
ncbi:MAG TPA: site-2 protease family protein [Planctomycetota bacterium]|nr:site-2 protease family protein [Planctomycetota bacterium]